MEKKEREREDMGAGRQPRGKKSRHRTDQCARVCSQLTKTSRGRRVGWLSSWPELTRTGSDMGSGLLMNPACQSEGSLSLPQGGRGDSSQGPGLVWGPQSFHSTSPVTTQAADPSRVELTARLWLWRMVAGGTHLRRRTVGEPGHRPAGEMI